MEEKKEGVLKVSEDDLFAIREMLEKMDGPAAVLRSYNSLQINLNSLEEALRYSRKLLALEKEDDHPPFNSGVTICEEGLGDDEFGVSLSPRPSVTRNTFSSATISEIAEELADRPSEESKAPPPSPRKKEKKNSERRTIAIGGDIPRTPNRVFGFFRENTKLILVGLGVVVVLVFSALGIKNLASMDSRGYKNYDDEEVADEPSAGVDDEAPEVGPPAPKPVEVDNLDKQAVDALTIKNGTAPKSSPVAFTTTVALDKKFVQPGDCGQLSGHDKEFDECLAFFEKALVVPKN
jgi:hypothetical protein